MARGGAFGGFVAPGFFRSLALVRVDAAAAPLEALAEAFARLFTEVDFDAVLFAEDFAVDRPAPDLALLGDDFALGLAGEGVAPKPNICIQEPPSFMP